MYYDFTTRKSFIILVFFKSLEKLIQALIHLKFRKGKQKLSIVKQQIHHLLPKHIDPNSFLYHKKKLTTRIDNGSFNVKHFRLNAAGITTATPVARKQARHGKPIIDTISSLPFDSS